MLNEITVNLDRSVVLIFCAGVLLALLLFKRQWFWNTCRWIAFIAVSSIVLLIANFIDPLELFLKLWMQSVNRIADIFFNLESIAVDSFLVYMCAHFILPRNKTHFNLLVAVMFGLCISNMVSYNTFAIMPLGTDSENMSDVDWLVTALNAITLGIVSTLFYMSQDKNSDDVPTKLTTTKTE